MAKKNKNSKKIESDDEGFVESTLEKLKLKDETVEAIWAIVFIVFSVFMILASVKSAGKLGDGIYHYLSVAFGVGYFLIPLLLLMLGVSFLRSLKHNFATAKIIGALMFFVSGLGMVHLMLPDRGGIVGGFIARPIIGLVDVQATFLFLSAIIVISYLIIFDTAISFGFIKNYFEKRRLEKEAQEKLEDEDSHMKVSGLTDAEVKAMELARELKAKEKGEEVPYEEKTDRGTSNEPRVKEFQNEDVGIFDNIFKRKMVSTFNPPPLNLLEGDRGKPGVGDVKANANLIKRTLQNFGIPVEMDEITVGPTVTRYALKPAEGVKLSKISALQDNLALALAAQSIRIEAPIPGKSLVGIEVPNTTKTTVGLATLLGTDEFQNSDKALLVALGKSVSGKPIYDNLGKMPHLLIAGTTGSGKSVTVHAILTSLLYRNSPDMLKFIMVDAKRVELTLYNKIPHLLTPVITEAKKTIMALRWAAKEMDRRYDILEKESVRDITSYHKKIASKSSKDTEDSEPVDTMPFIVIVIDELADLMQAYPRELEGAIVRLAQMSRAVGIHLILSTQRPSVNVITGLIKANVPTRIALKVGSQIDSRTIIDRAGAEKLVGQGDMLYSSQERPDPIRVQCPYISEDEVKSVVKFFLDAYKDEIPPSEIDFGTANASADRNATFNSLDSDDGGSVDEDELYEEARRLVIEAKRASTSYIQRKLRVGYARAARLMDMLEERGVIAPGDGSSKPREVLEGGAGQPEEPTSM